MNKNGKAGNAWIWVVAAVIIVFALGIVKLPSFGTGGGSDVIQTYAADAAYATQNAFSVESIAGTTYYAAGADGIFQTTAPKLERDKAYQYWVSNSTVYVKPLTFTASGSNNVINKVAYRTGSATITGYDVIYNCNTNDDVAATACNITLGANQEAKIDMKYLGGAKTANLPFGGVMVVEYNNTVPTQTCSGDGLVGLNNKYQVTYSDSATTNTHKVYELADGFDVSKNGGTTGVTNVIRCEWANGATAAAPGTVKITFIPANYYIGNDGKLYLDVEQKMNGANTRTGLTTVTKTFYTA
jgi:hypothetical protein